MPRTVGLSTLSARELDVARAIAEGKTYAEIGNALGVGFETVKTYADRLRTKTGRRTKKQLAEWYRHASRKE
jgi:DNA-binding CsgD family transcriptional regulator